MKKKIITILTGLGLATIPVFPATPLPPKDQQALLQMYNYEIQELCEVNDNGCKVVIKGAKDCNLVEQPKIKTQSQKCINFDIIAEQMNTKIKARPIKDKIYAKTRDKLINKYETSVKKSSLLDKTVTAVETVINNGAR